MDRVHGGPTRSRATRLGSRSFSSLELSSSSPSVAITVTTLSNSRPSLIMAAPDLVFDGIVEPIAKLRFPILVGHGFSSGWFAPVTTNLTVTPSEAVREAVGFHRFPCRRSRQFTFSTPPVKE